MTAGYGGHTTDAEPMTLRDAGLDESGLASMTKDAVDAYLNELFTQYVWETVGDSCGWKVEQG